MNLENLRSLWDAHSRPVYAYLLRLTRSPEEASDHLQDLFCRLARQPELVARLNGEPRGFLLRLARNGVIDQVRRAQTRDRIFEKINAARAGESIPAADPDQALIRRALDAALRQLPAEQRTVMVERLWKKRTLDEIAAELGISINTVASRYRYGLDKMREALRSLYEDLATSPSTEPAKSKSNPTQDPMKKNQPNPFTETEAPIIQPLEQRRVPSATGAFFALPLVPADDAAVEAPVGEVAVEVTAVEVPEIVSCDFPIFEKPIDPSAEIDPIGDELPPDVGVPIDFSDVVGAIDGETVDLSEGELDDMIFWSFGGPVDGEMGLIDEGVVEGEAVDGEFVDGEPGDREVVPFDWIKRTVDLPENPDDLALTEYVTDLPVDGEGEVVFEKTYDGQVDDGTAEHEMVGEGGVVPIEWVMRTNAGNTATEGEVVEKNFNAEIYQNVAGGGVSSDADHATGGDHEAAAHHDTQGAAPQVAQALPTPLVAQDFAPLDVQLGGSAPFFAVATPGGSFQSLDLSATTVAFDSHDFAAHDADHSAAGDFAHSTPLAGSNAIDAPEISWHSDSLDSHEQPGHSEHWVPLHDAQAGDSASHEVAALGVDQTGHVATAPVGASAAALATPSIPASGTAMAATGAMLAGSVTGKRERKQAE